MQAAWKVGLFVVIFAGLVLGGYALLEKNLFAKPVDVYYAEFADAGGVTTGSAVLFAGVKVGQVQEVILVGPKKARLALALDKGTQVPQGSTVMVPASFISLGDMRLMIVPPAQETAMLEPGATLSGRLSSPLESFAPESGKTMEEINKTLVSIQGLLGDKGLRNDLSALMVTLKDTTAKFGGLADRTNGLIAANSGRFASLLTTTSETLKNMQAVSLEVKKMVASGELQAKTTELLDNLNTAVKKGTELVADVQSLATDPEMRAALKDTLTNVKVMSDSGTKIAADAELMAANGVEITEETKALMKKANKLADQVQDLIEKFNATVGKIGSQGKSLTQGIEFEATVAQESNPGRVRLDTNVFIPVGKEKVMIGLFDAFESNKINFQLQKQVKPNLGLRYGAYASKPGIGVDYDFASRFGLRGDVFGLNEPRMDVRLQYRFAPGIIGWAGVNNVFERNSPSIGVTVHK